jgi:transcriptional regulator GlxA family with amidase domain
MNLYLIAETLQPVSTKAPGKEFNPKNSNFSQAVLPTHTFENAPALDVLIIPGGVGTRIPSIKSTVDFVADMYPKVQYCITVCTGSGVIARTGYLDGKKATTNKNRWDITTKLGPKVHWIKKARWVVDGNIWTSAGISAGIDVTLAFIEDTYGREVVDSVTNALEYERHLRRYLKRRPECIEALPMASLEWYRDSPVLERFFGVFAAPTIMFCVLIRESCLLLHVARRCQLYYQMYDLSLRLHFAR